MLLWLRVAVGATLTVSFAVPLGIIARDGSLREEPMTLFVINMTLVDLVFGALFMATGLADVVFASGVPAPLCATLQYLLFGCGVAWKAATLLLVALTWCCVPLMGAFGFTCYRLGLESSVAFDRRVLGVERHISQCRWELNAHLFMVVSEVAVLLLSLCSGVLFVYTAVQGARHEWRLHPNNRLLVRFKSFQRIVKVLLVVVTIDVVAAGVRVGSRWSAQLYATTLVQLLRVLCLLVEGWTYGLTQPAVRSALSTFFGWRRSRVGDVTPSELRRPTNPSSEWAERAATESPRF
ncbi:hypothetical protein FJT64_002683 [Amphibalanus amphitrite]|uniref:G-protein coupled receptors family 1 profile domain-containing protein n=1 Tax=Amphibalanus amphitrite TaxID=1232801 RepID=A0A6A4WA21_AMPAM|nr:hypothetical protein FJT64_002683 [Amphibalanus amphitrite]